MKQIEKAVSGKEPRFVLRALRALPSTSRRLNSNVLHKAVSGFFTSNPSTRDFLLAFLEEVGLLGLQVAGQSAVASLIVQSQTATATMLTRLGHCHPVCCSDD